MLKEGIYRQVLAAGASLAAIQIAGCAASNPLPLTSSGPSPSVEGGMLLHSATPTRFRLKPILEIAYRT
jgi:hypothetical protein